MNANQMAVFAIACLAACAEPPEAESPCCAAAKAAAAAQAVAPAPAAARTTDWPDDSVYQLGDTFHDQSAKARHLADFAGAPTLVAMMFTHCQYACPRLVADLHAIERGLEAAGDATTRIVLASMDDVRDTPVRLAAFAAEHQLGPRWTLLHGVADSVVVLNAVLGGRYKRTPGGDFAHANLIVVLDAEGRIDHRQEGLGVAPDATLAAVAALRAPPTAR